MKKLIVVFLYLTIQLSASFDKDLLSIYENILTDMFPNQTKIVVYVKDKYYKGILNYSSKLQVTSDVSKAMICIATKQSTIKDIIASKNNVIIFVTNQHFLYDYEEVIGAFYWTKGRRQLLFIKSRMDRHHIVLPKEYDHFIIDEL